jgi:hypothetical protein
MTFMPSEILTKFKPGLALSSLSSLFTSDEESYHRQVNGNFIIYI